MADNDDPKPVQITIKKYANRRLYNTATSSYVTLEELSRMVRGGTDFTVFDAKTGDDITRSVLTQIILEKENKGQNLLPIRFLKQLISFYGDSLQTFVPRYLELSMETFTHNQEQMRRSVEQAFGGLFPFRQVDDMGKQNMALFERALSLFSPSTPPSKDDKGSSGANASEIAELKERLDALQRQLDEIAKKGWT